MAFTRRATAIAVATLLLAPALVSLSSSPARASTDLGSLFTDGFATLPLGTGWTDGSVHGNWRSDYDGYGSTGTALDGATQVLSESPEASTSPSESHAALVTSVPTFGDLNATVSLRTVQQLRTPTPNPWEVGWFLWHYTDDTHFYYLILKPNGWELGKEDPAYPGDQRFLATSAAPSFGVGSWHTVRVEQIGATITVWGDGEQLTSFTDTQRPYLSGAVGLYDEDATVHFTHLAVWYTATEPALSSGLRLSSPHESAAAWRTPVDTADVATLAGEVLGSPTGLGGCMRSAPAVAVVGHAWLVAVQGCNDGVYVKRGGPSGWGGWQRLDGATNAAPSLSVTPTGAVFLAVRGTNYAAYLRAWTASGGWSPWRFLGGTCASAPAVAAIPTGGAAIAVAGPNHQIYAGRATPTGFLGWGSLGGATFSAPGITVDQATGAEWISIRGTNNAVYLRGLSRGWFSLGGATLDAPSLTVPTTGGLLISVRGTNNFPYLRQFVDGGWQPWRLA